MKDETLLITSGRPGPAHFGAVSTPVYRTSTILHETLAALEGASQPFTYGRRATPSTRALEEAIAALEGGARTVLVPSGLAACTLAILSVCGAGQHLLVSDGVYGPTRAFCQTVLKRYGVETTFYDPLIGAGIAGQFRPETAALFIETPSSLTFEMPDVPALVAAARAHGITTLLDNTWATPLLFKPLAAGVDLAILAATKYIAGHSDVNIGAVTAAPGHEKALVETHGRLGLTVSGDDAFLALRGLRTLALRLARQGETGLALACWLETRPEVARVLHPALPGDPGHAVWRRDFSGTAGLFGIALAPVGKPALARFMDGLELFGMGYSWGGFESLIVPANPVRTASTFAADGPLLRISAGLEAPEDLIADLSAGLARLTAEG